MCGLEDLVGGVSGTHEQNGKMKILEEGGWKKELRDLL